jgi:RimJ/RimL family protein N-acetyltransferase
MPTGNGTSLGMNLEPRLVAEWQGDRLRAFEPTREEIARFAPMLAGFYNDDYNRSMMANTVAMTDAEVVEHFEGLRRQGGRPFLLERDGVLLGDADLRHITAKTAEFAILIGQRPEQGKGIGTRFAILLHALAFRGLGLERIFVSIIPANQPSQRLFARIGYTSDDTPAARAFADDPTDLTLSLGRATFEAAHEAALEEIRWSLR